MKRSHSMASIALGLIGLSAPALAQEAASTTVCGVVSRALAAPSVSISSAPKAGCVCVATAAPVSEGTCVVSCTPHAKVIVQNGGVCTIVTASSGPTPPVGPLAPTAPRAPRAPMAPNAPVTAFAYVTPAAALAPACVCGPTKSLARCDGRVQGICTPKACTAPCDRSARDESDGEDTDTVDIQQIEMPDIEIPNFDLDGLKDQLREQTEHVRELVQRWSHPRKDESADAGDDEREDHDGDEDSSEMDAFDLATAASAQGQPFASAFGDGFGQAYDVSKPSDVSKLDEQTQDAVRRAMKYASSLSNLDEHTQDAVHRAMEKAHEEMAIAERNAERAHAEASEDHAQMSNEQRERAEELRNKMKEKTSAAREKIAAAMEKVRSELAAAGNESARVENAHGGNDNDLERRIEALERIAKNRDRDGEKDRHSDAQARDRKPRSEMTLEERVAELERELGGSAKAKAPSLFGKDSEAWKFQWAPGAWSTNAPAVPKTWRWKLEPESKAESGVEVYKVPGDGSKHTLVAPGFFAPIPLPGNDDQAPRVVRIPRAPRTPPPAPREGDHKVIRERHHAENGERARQPAPAMNAEGKREMENLMRDMRDEVQSLREEMGKLREELQQLPHAEAH